MRCGYVETFRGASFVNTVTSNYLDYFATKISTLLLLLLLAFWRFKWQQDYTPENPFHLEVTVLTNEAPLKVSTSFGPLIGGESFLLKIGDINLCFQSHHLRSNRVKVKADLHSSAANPFSKTRLIVGLLGRATSQVWDPSSSCPDTRAQGKRACVVSDSRAGLFPDAFVEEKLVRDLSFS